jgi:hypothetical protein
VPAWCADVDVRVQGVKRMGSALNAINELRGLNVLQGSEKYCVDGNVRGLPP